MKQAIRHLLDQRVRLCVPACRQDAPHDPWALLVLTASWHLEHRIRADAPRRFHDEGESLFWRQAARNTILRHDLEQVVRLLVQSGIQAIVLKGMVFAETLYPSPGLRPMEDIDLLVRPDDFETAYQVLLKEGWTPCKGATHASPEITNWERGDFGQVAEIVLRNARDTLLELHWHLIPYVWQRSVYSVDMEEVWTCAEPLAITGLEQAYGLGATHTMAYMCLHQALHGLQHPIGYLDAALFIRKMETAGFFKWEDVAACADAWRIRSAVFHVLLRTHFLFGTPLPRALINELAPSPLSMAIVNRLYPPHALLSGKWVAGRKQPSAVRAALVDRLGDLVALAWYVLLPKPSWRRYRYGKDASLMTHWRHTLKRLRSEAAAEF